MRVNFVGELGWELHHPIEMQNTIFDLLMDAGGWVRSQALRHPGHGLAALREVLPHVGDRALHRVCGAGIGAAPLRAPEQGRVHRPRRPRRVAGARLRQRLRHHGGARRERRPTPGARSRFSSTVRWSGRATGGGLRLAKRARAWRWAWCAPTWRRPAPRSRSRFSASATAPRSSPNPPSTRRTSASGREGKCAFRVSGIGLKQHASMSAMLLTIWSAGHSDAQPRWFPSERPPTYRRRPCGPSPGHAGYHRRP